MMLAEGGSGSRWGAREAMSHASSPPGSLIAGNMVSYC